MNTPPNGSLLTIALALGVTSAAHSEIVYSSYDNSEQYAFIVYDMPDFDQRRSSLPNTGDCYCGPASVADLLGYVSTHGYPDVDPGIPWFSWRTTSSYNEMTGLIAQIGISTSVNPGGSSSSGCGTSQNNLYDELVSRIGDRFTIRNAKYSLTHETAPDTAHIARRGYNDQAVGLMLYGRWAGSFDGGTWVTTSGQRRGGHFEAVNVAIRGGDITRLGVRNPYENDLVDDQSEFATEWFDVTERSVRIGSSDMTMDQLNNVYYSSSGSEYRMQLLEGYLSIAPKACYSWSEVNNSLLRIVPMSEEWSHLGRNLEEIPYPGAISQVAFGPDDLSIAVIMDGKLFRTKRHADQDQGHERINLGNFDEAKVHDIAFGPDRNLYVLAGQHLVVLNYDATEIIDAYPCPGQGERIAIENGIAHVLIPESNLLVAFDRNNGPDGVFIHELPLPGDAQVNENSRIAMLPGGRFFLLTDGTVNSMRITENGLARVWTQIPRDGEWADISTDDGMTICLLDRNGLVESWRFMDNTLVPHPGHALHGIQAGTRLTVARSTSNADPETNELGGPFEDDGQRTIELDCRSDLNFDRQVDSADIGILLSEWGQQRSIADIDRDGSVGSADLGMLLANFGPCR